MLVGRRWVTPNRREWTLIAVCGVAWFAAYNVALNAAEQRVDAGTTAMLVNVGPILIALFAGLLLGEGFPRWLVIGALVAFAGAVLVGAATAQGTSDVWGAVLCLVAAVTYAIGVLAQKPVVRRLPAAAGHVPGLRDRRRGLPALRARPGARRRDSAPDGDRMADLPRRWCRPRWRSARGPTRSPAWTRDGSASPPTPSRPSPSRSARRSWARRRRSWPSWAG